jgi:hypothetical protein
MFYTAGALVLSATSALAATDGTVGATSTGTINVSIEILEEVQITGFVANGDIDFGIWDSTSVTDEDSVVNVCVYRNHGPNYGVTVTTDTGAFELAGAAVPANVIPFGIVWDLAGEDTAVVYNTRFTSATGEATVDCGATFPVPVEFRITNAALNAQTNLDTYSALVTFVVDPE